MPRICQENIEKHKETQKMLIFKEICDETLQNTTKKLQKFSAHASMSSIRYSKKTSTK